MFKQYWENTNKLKDTHSPLLFRMDSLSDKAELGKIIASNHGIRVYDEIHAQLIELVKLRQPNKRLSLNEINLNISHHTDGKEMEDFGVWVFYPWNNCLIHILDEKDFIEVRTNRNKHKITQKEQILTKLNE